ATPPTGAMAVRPSAMPAIGASAVTGPATPVIPSRAPIGAVSPLAIPAIGAIAVTPSAIGARAVIGAVVIGAFAPTTGSSSETIGLTPASTPPSGANTG